MKILRNALVAALLIPCGLHAQATSSAPDKPSNGPDAPRRTFLQWTEMKGAKTQIFIDLNNKEKRVYQGANPKMNASLLLQLPGNGSASMMKYQGTGADWQWIPVDVHAVLSHPSPGVDRVDFDYLPLGSSQKITVLFESLDNDWKAVASSKILQWHPN